MPNILSANQAAESKLIAAAIRHEILEGHYGPNEALPSLREISRQFGVGMRVARNAVRELVRDRLVYTVDRQGAFVSSCLSGDREGVGLQRVTIVERVEGIHPAFNREAYFHSYTTFLADRQVEMRTAVVPETEQERQALLSPDIPLEHQGCVLVNVIDTSLMSWLNEQGVPYVVQCFRPYVADGLPDHHSVIVNKVAGGFDAVNHLLALGHRRIGFIGSYPDFPEDETSHTLNVFDGYISALKYAAISCNPAHLLAPASNEEEVSMQLAAEYLSRPDLPTAVLTQTDMTASCLLRVARDRGIRIPKDMSIIGFDGVAESAFTNPPLTTVAVPRRVLGQEALRLLFDVVGGHVKGPQRRVLSCQLTVRKSTGPAPV